MRAAHIALALAVATGGCASFIDKQAAQSTYRIVESSLTAAERQSDIELAREAMPGGILQLEAFALAYPSHAGFRKLHAEAICQYATAFVFDDWEDAALANRTAEADRIAERLTRLLDTCVTAQRALLPRDWQVDATTREQAPHVLAIAMAGTVRIALSPLANLRRMPEVKAMLARCAQVAPGLQDATAEVMLGTLESATAVFGGPDGSARFAQARKLAPTALSVEVMFARAVAVARKDRKLFEATLERVVDADVSRWPERRLANELARRKASRYLAARDQLLPD